MVAAAEAAVMLQKKPRKRNQKKKRHQLEVVIYSEEPMEVTVITKQSNVFVTQSTQLDGILHIVTQIYSWEFVTNPRHWRRRLGIDSIRCAAWLECV